MTDEGWSEFTGNPSDSGDGESALRALSEIGHQRRLLDEAELNAVRAARRAHMSWAEIATKLGVSRQSAWEKWRDLDNDEWALGVDEWARSRLSRFKARTTALVPDIVGLPWGDAMEALEKVRLVGVLADVADPQPFHTGETVLRQYPDPDTRVRVGSEVKAWIEEDGGSAGVREPRRPVPPLREATAEVDIESVVGE